jgi:hypothetical protein
MTLSALELENCFSTRTVYDSLKKNLNFQSFDDKENINNSLKSSVTNKVCTNLFHEKTICYEEKLDSKSFSSDVLTLRLPLSERPFKDEFLLKRKRNNSLHSPSKLTLRTDNEDVLSKVALTKIDFPAATDDLSITSLKSQESTSQIQNLHLNKEAEDLTTLPVFCRIRVNFESESLIAVIIFEESLLYYLNILTS